MAVLADRMEVGVVQPILMNINKRCSLKVHKNENFLASILNFLLFQC